MEGVLGFDLYREHTSYGFRDEEEPADMMRLAVDMMGQI